MMGFLYYQVYKENSGEKWINFESTVIIPVSQHINSYVKCFNTKRIVSSDFLVKNRILLKMSPFPISKTALEP